MKEEWWERELEGGMRWGDALPVWVQSAGNATCPRHQWGQSSGCWGWQCTAQGQPGMPFLPPRCCSSPSAAMTMYTRHQLALHASTHTHIHTLYQLLWDIWWYLTEATTYNCFQTILSHPKQAHLPLTFSSSCCTTCAVSVPWKRGPTRSAVWREAACWASWARSWASWARIFSLRAWISSSRGSTSDLSKSASSWAWRRNKDEALFLKCSGSYELALCIAVCKLSDALSCVK